MNEEAPSTQTKGKKDITTQVEIQNQLVNTDTIFSEVQNETNVFENMHDRAALVPDEAKSENTTAADNKTKWICEYCTYENFPLSLKCTMCRAVKPLLGEDIYRLKEVDAGASAEAAALFSYDNHQQVNAWSVEKKVNAESLHERVRPLKISPASSEVQPSVSVPKWPCPACTYENWPKTLKCAMCGTNNNSKTSPLPSHTSLFNSNNGDKESSLHPGLYDTVTGNNKISLKHSNSRLQLGINEICTTPSAQSIHDLDSNSRRLKRQTDWAWLQACLGVVDGDQLAVEQYLAGGGDPARALTAAEVTLLNRASAFDTGHTLVHLAIRFQREDILSTLLSQISGGGSGIKRAPSYIAPDLASAIRRHVASTIRYKKGSFQCRFLQEFVTFSLPAEVEELPHAIQEQLFEELLDRDAQQQLESEPPVINWSLELTVRLGSRLYALWNRSAGDCLLDAVMQAQWGVFDRDNTLRRALSESLHNAGRSFYPRWREYECLQASLLSYSLDESQLLADWSRLVAGAGVAGRSLQQVCLLPTVLPSPINVFGYEMHVFALAHITRRPIIVYGVNVVNSFRGEAIGYARFQGIYLPLLWEPEFCSKSPLCLGYTRGHFSALVPVEAYSQSANAEYICREQEDDSQDMTFLPLTDADGKLLPVHFLNMEETGSEESLVRRWLEVCVSGGGLLVAQQRLHKRPLLVAQLLEEWLNHYRQIAQQTRGPFPPRLQAQAPEFSSDGDTDEE